MIELDMIRYATLDDLDVLMDLAELMHQESPRYSRLSFNSDKVLALYVNLINTGIVLVVEKDQQIVGGLAGFVAPHWFSDDLVASEFGVFLLPDHRGGTAVVRLIKEFIRWSKDKGAKMIQIGVSTGVRTEETAALYKAIGLKPCSFGFEV